MSLRERGLGTPQFFGKIGRDSEFVRYNAPRQSRTRKEKRAKMPKIITSQIQLALRAAFILAALAVALAVGHSAQAQQEKTKTERLLKAELDPFTADENGWTHMHWAAAADDGEAIRRLIELGGSTESTDHGDDSEFSTAGHRRASLLGVKLGEWKNTGDTPLIVAAEFGKSVAASVLIASGADVNAKINGDWTPLHSTATENAADIARMLLENGAEVNAKDDDGDTPLHMAAHNNAADVARMLLENGVDINAKNKKERTPLHRAAWNNAMEAAQLLIERGAKINVKDKWDEAPLDDAVAKDHAEMQSFLRRHGGRCNKRC